jgi:hypothetical protein
LSPHPISALKHIDRASTVIGTRGPDRSDVAVKGNRDTEQIVRSSIVLHEFDDLLPGVALTLENIGGPRLSTSRLIMGLSNQGTITGYRYGIAKIITSTATQYTLCLNLSTTL